MKVFAVHDLSGTVTAVVTAPDGPVSVGMVTEAGSLMTEVELPSEMRIDAMVDAEAGAEEISRLADVVSQYRVVRDARAARLEPQSQETDRQS